MKPTNYVQKYLNKHQNLLEDYIRESNKISKKIKDILEREDREIIFEDKTLGSYMLLEGKLRNIAELKRKVGLSIENDGSVVMFLRGGSNED